MAREAEEHELIAMDADIQAIRRKGRLEATQYMLDQGWRLDPGHHGQAYEPKREFEVMGVRVKVYTKSFRVGDGPEVIWPSGQPLETMARILIEQVFAVCMTRAHKVQKQKLADGLHRTIMGMME